VHARAPPRARLRVQAALTRRAQHHAQTQPVTDHSPEPTPAPDPPGAGAGRGRRPTATDHPSHDKHAANTTTTAGEEDTGDHRAGRGEHRAPARRVRPADRAYHLARVRAGFRTTISPESARRLARLLSHSDHSPHP